MRKSKLNCWEFKNCGRETGGARSHELGICPAAVETRLEGIHDGNCAGRACWTVSGTLCEGDVQGTFAKKYNNCKSCDFYLLVRNGEGPNFTLSATLLSIIKPRTWAGSGDSAREEAPLCYTRYPRSSSRSSSPGRCFRPSDNCI